jgi:hypothetical protein
VKTSELQDAALDWAVAKANGQTRFDFNSGGVSYWLAGWDRKRTYPIAFAPSTDWAQGGLIIEREGIGIWPSESIEGMWAARPDYEVYPERLPPSYGTTPLIAAMRCYVASKLGDDVTIPEELK